MGQQCMRTSPHWLDKQLSRQEKIKSHKTIKTAKFADLEFSDTLLILSPNNLSSYLENYII